MVARAGQRRLDHDLAGQRRFEQQRQPGFRRHAAGDQARRDRGEARQPHIDDERLSAGRERLPVDPVLAVGGGMAGDEDQRLVGLARRRRNAGVSKAADPGGDSRHDAKANASLGQRLDLLAAAAEHERIAAFQAQHAQVLPRQFDQPQRDVFLAVRRPAAALAGKFAPRLRPGERQHAFRDQRVIDDHVGFFQRVEGVQRQQAGIARPGADQPHGSRLERNVGRMRLAHATPFGFELSGKASIVAVMSEVKALRYGWTTGCCAAAAASAAFEALIAGEFPDPVEVLLPNGARPSFALALSERGADHARAGVVKDAGDDPDVTHGVTVIATVRRGAAGGGIAFRAGPGVGTVTKPGLPVAPGEPAINPAPRRMIAEALTRIAERQGVAADAIVEISIPGGEKIAEKTLNPRLGIKGGLSVLGTTGIVVPFSCSAWIHSIHRGVDVARACGLTHLAGATGSTSEEAVTRLHGLVEEALIDMGDFVGGFLKYLRKHPVETVTIAGGFAKMTKLGQGLLDLHSRRGEVDLDWLAALAASAGLGEELAARIRAANTAMEAHALAREAGFGLAAGVAEAAWRTAAKAAERGAEKLEIVVVGRDGAILATTGIRPLH